MGELKYFDPKQPNSYRGAYLQNEKEWLKGEDTYTFHFPLRKNFKRQRVVVSGIDAQFQSDLMDLQSISKHNRGFRFIVIVIDVFSKYVWMIPIKNKTGSSIISAFKRVFRDRVPLALQTDQGSEFTNRAFQSYLKENKVRYFYTRSELKSSVVERYIRTIRAIMYRYFTKNNTSNYINALDDFAYSYNRTYHRSIGMAPNDVNSSNQESVWRKLYGFREATQPELAVGLAVRISKNRNRFEKSARANWQKEIFYIAEALKGDPPVYRLRDYGGESIEGRFYREELQPVKEPQTWRIEKIIRRRKRSGTVQYLVRWLGYGSQFDSWIDKKDIE